ncbi:MAG: pilus assembly protein N-terminal domain-containing protein [Pseudomonadota bacterium]
MADQVSKARFGLAAALAPALGWLMAAGPAPAQLLAVPVDKAELIRLNEDAAVVLIANPAIADVAVEQNRLVIVVGKAPGETRLLVFDAKGRQLAVRDVVVVPEEARAVTVVRGVAESNLSCAPRCVAVGAAAAAAGGAAPAAGAPASGGAAPGAPAAPLPPAISALPGATATAPAK